MSDPSLNLNPPQIWVLLRKHSGLRRRTFNRQVCELLDIAVATRGDRGLYNILKHTTWEAALKAAITIATRAGGPIT